MSITRIALIFIEYAIRFNELHHNTGENVLKGPPPGPSKIITLYLKHLKAYLCYVPHK